MEYSAHCTRTSQLGWVGLVLGWPQKVCGLSLIESEKVHAETHAATCGENSVLWCTHARTHMGGDIVLSERTIFMKWRTSNCNPLRLRGCCGYGGGCCGLVVVVAVLVFAIRVRVSERVIGTGANARACELNVCNFERSVRAHLV